MIIAYYRKTNGEIRMAHKMPDAFTMEEAQRQAATYNKRVKEETVELVEAPDDSLMAFLYNGMTQNVMEKRDEFRLIIDDLESVLDRLSGMVGL